MKKLRLINFTPLLTTIPAVTIGVIAMIHNKVPTSIWIQNIACLIIIGLISCILSSTNFNRKNDNISGFFIIIPLLLLILTFMARDLDGVHRWVSLGPIRFNVSFVVLPITMVLLWEIFKSRTWWLPAIITVIISTLLFIQPDASQLTGFAIPMMIMLCSKTNKNILRLITIGTLSTLVILSWVFLDNLPPVDYVEGIVSLLANMGYLWLALGVLSLIVLPMPFIFFPPEKLKLPSACIGLYYILILISTLFGNFPVPLMGYGVSPIIGYFISITWYTKAKINS